MNDIGSVRGTFIASMLAQGYKISESAKGDFLIDEK